METRDVNETVRKLKINRAAGWRSRGVGSRWAAPALWERHVIAQSRHPARKLWERHPVARKVGLAPVVALAAFLLTFASARAGFVFDAEVPMDARVEAAIDRAQEWLVKQQRPNGSWGNCNGRNGLACMALMCNGNTPGHGKYGAKVAQGIDFIIGSQHENGYLVVGDTGNMYQHALATLALVEAYGMSQNPAIREAVIKAVDLILSAQNQTGGWRYTPTSQDADLSVTVMQTMALRAAVEVGVYVPKESIDFAVAYVRKNFNENTGSFGYTGVDAGN
jgi:hypothetical protein